MKHYKQINSSNKNKDLTKKNMKDANVDKVEILSCRSLKQKHNIKTQYNKKCQNTMKEET